ncbi:MAG: putative oxidoreductase [Verrucomicrobia bacterium]|nr:putative oxidoreductase [Verrucomicrobiota bacterium]
MSTGRFSQQRILVTGAGKGIGREIARRLAAEGAEIIAVSRTPADLASLADDIACATIPGDLADADNIRRIGEAAGRVDFLVNNAGISIPEPFLQTTAAAFDATIAINVRGALLLSQIIAKGWIARGHAGVIVNVSSQASLAALRDHSAYCASKGALDALTRVMALELGPHGIRVNTVNPTVTLTPMGAMAWGDAAKSGPMLEKIPLGRFAASSEVAAVVAFLLSSDAAMINGISLPVDGGFLAT